MRRFSVLFIIACLLAYGYLTVSSVLHVVMDRELVERGEIMKTRIAELEAEHFIAARAVTPNKAAEMGLVAVTDKVFATESRALGRAQ